MFAFCANISRITAVRSRADRWNIRSKLNCCPGVNSSLNTTVSTSKVSAKSYISLAFPLPIKVAGSGEGFFCMTVSTTSAPAVLIRRHSSSSSRSTDASSFPSPTKPTAIIRSLNDLSMRPRSSPPRSPNPPRCDFSSSSAMPLSIRREAQILLCV